MKVKVERNNTCGSEHTDEMNKCHFVHLAKKPTQNNNNTHTHTNKQTNKQTNKSPSIWGLGVGFFSKFTEWTPVLKPR